MLSKEWTGKLAATFLVSLLGVAALPSQYAGFPLDDRRPIYRGNVRTRDLKAETELIVNSDISVASQDGRAVGSTTAAPIGESLKMVTKQLLQAPSATDMVATDVRTPPRVKSQLKPQQEANAEFVPLGKGEALPIVMEDPSSYQVVTSAPVKSSTPSSGGISTWILLSNGEQSTMATNKKKPSVTPTADPKKTTTKVPAPVAEKYTKKEDNTAPKSHHKPNTQTKKQNTTKDEPQRVSTIILQDSKFKNRTPVVVGRVPAPQNKTDSKKPTTQGVVTMISTTPTPKKKPISLSPTSPTKYVPEIVPTTSLVLESGPVTSEETTTTESSTTTKKTRRPSTNKKKKKNKNRRRRPAKPADSDSAESKIQETAVASNKIETNRPISTRIYNYLAREVMPSVGVGIVGLVLTAGLAGLFLYPFGGGIARRNYEKGTGPMHDHHMYYYNSYNPHPEKETSNAQPEEKVFGQVLSSISQSAYGGSYGSPVNSTKYSTNHKYRYDYGSGVNGYAGSNDYSTLPDSVKNGDYSLTDSIKGSDYEIKGDSYASALTASHAGTDYMPSGTHAKDSEFMPSTQTKGTDYMPSKSDDYISVPTHTKTSEYMSEIKSSDYLPESSKYYSMDPLSSHYKLTDGASKVDKYPSFTEYTSFTNPASVGTSDFQPTQENKTDISMGEDKSDKSQPQFSALVGSPQFSNSDFVGSVSLTGSYGTQEVHRTGALASDHGPRSMKNIKNRKKRDVHDDFSNEIDDSLDKTTKKPQVSTTPNLSEATTISSNSVETTSKESTTPEAIAQTESSETTLDPLFTSTEDSNKAGDTSTETPISDNQNSGGLMGFLARLAQLKLQLGISLLKTTGEAFHRYLNTMAKRMETAVRSMEKKQRSHQNWFNHNREKRDASYQKRMYKKYKQ